VLHTRYCFISRAPPYPGIFSLALVGFQGRGCADVVQPNCCHPFLLEALLFQWLSIRRCASRTMVELKTPESNKSVEAKSENRVLEDQGLASPNFPVFGNLRQSCHAPRGHYESCKCRPRDRNLQGSPLHSSERRGGGLGGSFWTAAHPSPAPRGRSLILTTIQPSVWMTHLSA